MIRKDLNMPTRAISFITNFGGVMKQYQCPNCGDIYMLDDDKVNEGTTHCWRCHKPYLQKFCTTSNFKFVRDAIHRVKGD